MWNERCVFLYFKVKWKPSLQKHPAGTAGARPCWFSSCGHVSTGTPGKENKGTGLKMRQCGTSFLMSSVFCLKALCHMTLWFQIFKPLAVTLSNMVCFPVCRSGSWTPCVICTRRWRSPRLSSSSTPGEKSTGWRRRCMQETSPSLLWYHLIHCSCILRVSPFEARSQNSLFTAWRHGPEGARCDHEGVQIRLQQSVDHYWPSG